MKNLMEYKGYLGSVNYNDEDEIFYGRIEYIRSLSAIRSWRIRGLNPK